MARADAEEQSSIEGVDVVVDTDAHVAETLDDFLPYMEERYSGPRRILEHADHPLHDVYAVSHPLPPFPHSSRQDDLYGEGLDDQAERKLDEMAEFGIDYAILNPTLNLALPTVKNTRVAVALANAYNSWMVDTFLDREAFKSPILVAPQKPHKAAEEIDRLAGEDGVVGVQIPATGLNPPAGNVHFDPIYEAAQDHGLPVLYHSGSGATASAFPLQRMHAETYSEDHTFVHPASHMWNLTTMIFQGVPERFPDLDFVLQESGIAWLPYWVWRMDDHYLVLNDEVPILNRLPSEYVDESFYISTQPLGHTARDPKHLAWAVEMAGPENVMYASDLPHPDFDPPEELFDRIRGHFDAETVDRVMGATAAEVFGL